MPKTNMTRRTAIGLACGATGVAALATVAGLYASRAESRRRRAESLMRDDHIPVAADVRGYMLEHADGVPHALAAAGTAAPRATDTGLPVRLVYTFVDASLVPEDMDFDRMWSDQNLGPRAHYATYSFVRTLTDVGNPDYYVLLATPWLFNDTDLDISYVAYAHDNDNGEIVDGCRFDRATGLIYVPHSHYESDPENLGFQTLRIQMMLRVDLERRLESRVPVRVLCEDERLDIPTKLEGTCSGHALETVIPLCKPEQVETLKQDELSWWVSGMDLSQTACARTFSVDEDGNLHIDYMGFAMAGIEICVKRPSDAAPPMGTRIALALDSWDEMPIWPWGYLRYDDRLQQMCDNNTIVKFNGNGTTVTAFDSGSWANNETVKGYIEHYFHILAPYTYNIPIGQPDTPPEFRPLFIDTSPKQNILAVTRQLYTDPETHLHDWFKDGDRWKTFPEIMTQGWDQDALDAWQHWVMIPSCDQLVAVENDMGLGINYWRTIKNVEFDNDTMIGTPEENNPRYISCVLANAICIHIEEASAIIGGGPINSQNAYIGPVYVRVLDVQKDAHTPNVTLALYTDGFGVNQKAQSAQAIIRFQLRPNTGFAEMQKGVTF